MSFVCFVNVLFMIKWIDGATLTACRLEEIDCEKYQLVFASAEDV